MSQTTPTIDPRRTMLLVMDYQTAILNMVPDSGELLTRTAGALRLARSRGLSVGYVWVAFSEADYEAVPETNKGFSQLAARRLAPLDDPDSAIHAAVAPQPGDVTVRKTRVGAFSTTDLARQLEARGIDTLILAGISTSGVVLSTLREAADRDYRIYVLEDACLDRDPEVHQLLMEKVFPSQAYVIATDDLSGLLE